MAHQEPINDQRKAIIRQLWKGGSSMGEIARSTDKPPATVFSYLQYHGGIRPNKRVRGYYPNSYLVFLRTNNET